MAKSGYKVQDLTGKRFGRLTVLKQSDKPVGSYVSAEWVCKCDCGNTIAVDGYLLKRGDVKSCGCLRQELGAESIQRLRKESYVAGTHLDGLKQKVRKDSASGVKGVYYRKDRHQWQAYITFQGVKRWLGSYPTLEEAQEARRKAEIEYFDPVLEEYGKKKTKGS